MFNSFRKSFMAYGRSEINKMQEGISRKLCYHLIKLIQYPTNESVNHWIDDEIKVWIYDTYTGIRPKNKGMKKPYIRLYSDITLSNDDYDSNRISDIISLLSKKYGEGKYNEREVEEKLDEFIGLFDDKKVYTKGESSEIILNWYTNCI